MVLGSRPWRSAQSRHGLGACWLLCLPRSPSLAPPGGHLTLWALSQRSPHCRDTSTAALHCASYWTPEIMSWLMSLTTLPLGRVSGQEGDRCREP